MLYNVYCDESCHLQKDNSPIMFFGAMYILKEKRTNIYGYPHHKRETWIEQLF